jgi:hypothetical protein
MDQEHVLADDTLLGELVRSTFGGNPGEFHPCAYYDEPLDCIRVITRDCSVNEWRVSPHLTILEDNYPESEDDLYVGFTIKGARYICQENRIDLSVPVQLSELLDRILAAHPGDVVRMAVNAIAKPLVRKEHIRGLTTGAANEREGAG